MILNTHDSALQNLGSNLDHVTELQADDIAFLKRIFRSKQINALFKIYSKIARKAAYKKCTPALSAAVPVIIDVLDLLTQYSHQSHDAKELFRLLQKPHIQGLICAHDSVAQKDYQPHLPELTFDLADDEESLKIVQLVKSNDPIKGDVNSAEPIVGATIKNDDETGKIVFARIFAGGVADRSGLINVGDEIVEVNNTSVVDKTPNDILNILRNSDATITFKLIPVGNKSRTRESKTRVRAFFDYCAANDSFIPCKEVGLDFRRGDILHIVSQDDSYWWQAKKESDTTNTVGLIPSRALQEKRIVHEKKQQDTSSKLDCFSSSSEDNCISGSQKVKKIMYNSSGANEDFDRAEIPTYEEVAQLFPMHSPRPIVLIGAPGIGKNELRRRLIAKNPKRYVSPIAHTTREPKASEVDGVDYYFIAREQMEKDIEDGKFIEFGEYKDNLYGTSKESVQSIMQLGQVCVLCPHYRALKTIRSAALKPFVIFVKCPELETLKRTRTARKALSTFDAANLRAFSDEEFDTMLAFSNRIETLYNHWFDEIIINDELYRTVDALNTLVERLENEPSWVPVSWVQ